VVAWSFFFQVSWSRCPSSLPGRVVGWSFFFSRGRGKPQDITLTGLRKDFIGPFLGWNFRKAGGVSAINRMLKKPVSKARVKPPESTPVREDG